MKNAMSARVSALLSTALLMAGCSADPVELPEELLDAARTCFAAESLNQRSDAEMGADVTLAQFNAAMAYPMKATSMTQPFDIEATGTIMDGAGEEIERVRALDWEDALPQCRARFGMNNPVELPQDDADAALSCYIMSMFYAESLRGQNAEMDQAAARYDALKNRLEPRAMTSPAIIAASEAEAEQLSQKAAQRALSTSDPVQFLSLCEARFPAD